MIEDAAVFYDAYASRDARFDGVFFVGVTSTGIYCRPVCTAKTPRMANCRFFRNAGAAESEGFRPCLRCRPELAPGSAPVDGTERIAAMVARRIDEGMLDDGGGMERLAARFGWSTRQIRRMVRRELGVSPMELVLTRRLLLAKQLLTDTRLPVGEVALASGFSSRRRFNDAFTRRYGMPPTRLRRGVDDVDTGSTVQEDVLTLRLSYRPPLDWSALLEFLQARALAGVEEVSGLSYRRTVSIGGMRGWICVRPASKEDALEVEIPRGLTTSLPSLLHRVRDLFDLRARPDVIADQLRRDPILTGPVDRSPGLRVPGAFDGFEVAVRAILGQQVSVRAATTLAARFGAAFGEPVETPFPELDRLSPTAVRVAAATVDEVASLGIVGSRARSIVTLAGEIASGRLLLDGGATAEDTILQLVDLPGIGPWTAHYIAMRALRWPDAFPGGDLVLRKRLGGVTAAVATAHSERWSPWRSYAVMHLWRGDATTPPVSLEPTGEEDR